MKILVVEDDSIMKAAIGYSLEHEGYTVVPASDGIEALQILQKDKIGLVISDIMLPNLSGLGLLSMLKRFYYEKLPVILISALDQKDIMVSAAGLGAADFIIKPFSIEELKQKIRKVI